MDTTWLDFMDRMWCLRFVETLLHFLWQGCVVALVVLLLGRLLRSASARIRYALNLAALISMVACLPITYRLLPARIGEVAEASPAGQRPG